MHTKCINRLTSFCVLYSRLPVSTNKNSSADRPHNTRMLYISLLSTYKVIYNGRMNSIRELFRIGYGPSSSHTMAPRKAAEHFLDRCPDAQSYLVTLYGSLAATGEGHGTGEAVSAAFVGKDCKVDVLWKPEEFLSRHPNAMTFTAYDSHMQMLDEWTAYSIGGGALASDDDPMEGTHVYELDTMADILNWCDRHGRQLWEYVVACEGDGILDYLQKVWSVMKHSIRRGIEQEGVLPGGLFLPRKAARYYAQSCHLSGPIGKRSKVYAYALAAAEENEVGAQIVTAPTCGSAGVLPAVLLYIKEVYHVQQRRLIRSLATAGLIGNLIKYRASISGAEVGCQGEIGAACAMASGAATHLMGGSNYQVEYAAEMGLEHHLGLTCDPILGLVQIPCIERNALGAARALNHMAYSLLSDGRHQISFDKIVEVMKETGKALPSLYRETSLGGLAGLHADKSN